MGEGDGDIYQNKNRIRVSGIAQNQKVLCSSFGHSEHPLQEWALVLVLVPTASISLRLRRAFKWDGQVVE